MNDDIEKYEKRKKRIKDEYFDGNINKVEFEEYVKDIDKDIQSIQKQIEGVQALIQTNLTPKVEYAILLINNLQHYFKDAPVEVKQRLLGLIFPEKIEFDGKSFQTEKYNAVVDAIYNETKQLRGIKKDNSDELSVSVAGEGFEPTTSGL